MHRFYGALKIFPIFAREGAQAQPLVPGDSQNVMAIIENHYLIKCRLTK